MSMFPFPEMKNIGVTSISQIHDLTSSNSIAMKHEQSRNKKEYSRAEAVSFPI